MSTQATPQTSAAAVQPQVSAAQQAPERRQPPKPNPNIDFELSDRRQEPQPNLQLEGESHERQSSTGRNQAQPVTQYDSNESNTGMQTFRADEYGFGTEEALTVTTENLHAFNDPRDLSTSEPVVDLDALDIFDDLEDYVDLDKIDVIEDVDASVVAEESTEEEKSAGDELRELIKGRIKQAADMPGEAHAAREMSGAADKAAAAGMGSRNKFVGGKAQPQAAPAETPGGGGGGFVRAVPADIRKAAMILGVRPEDMTKAQVIAAWKAQIASPGVHPDLGGDTEAAIYLNTAKDTLVHYLDAQAPKLGKKFGKRGDGGAPGAVPNPPAQ
jgi:hypothetical protein